MSSPRAKPPTKPVSFLSRFFSNAEKKQSSYVSLSTMLNQVGRDADGYITADDLKKLDEHAKKPGPSPSRSG